VEAVLASARRRPTVYAVPGHPLVGEATVRRLLERCADEGLSFRLVPGLSFLDAVFSALQVDPLAGGLDVVDALAPPRQIERATVFCQVYSREAASALKLSLMETLPDETPVAIVRAAGTPTEAVAWLPLYQIDRQDTLDHLTCVYLPAPGLEANLGSFNNFRRIVARLRGPDGCPWDRAQTHQTITQYLIEETYEVVDALDIANAEKLAEELGDLLLQVVLHAQIAEDSGEFALEDVVAGIAAKMVRRHPHVFGDATAHTPEDVVRRWEVIKQAEREEAQSVLSGIPRHLPALAYAESVQRKAASLGFEWPAVADAVAKVAEEAAELEAETAVDRRREEFGDLIFALVNVARMNAIDPEEALRAANRRFAARFASVERMARERGQAVADTPLANLLEMWDRAKGAGEPVV
jgi:tetrapyrrole methylase family protein/MazG family protein